MGLATAIIGGSIASGILGKRAADKAADAQVAAGDKAIGVQDSQYRQTREDYAPFRESGYGYNERLDRANAGDMSDFYASPGYNFVRGEGMRDVGNQYAARGGGGNAMKALAEYTAGLASGEFNNWYGRQERGANRGMGATGATTSAGVNMANNVGNAMLGQGQAQAEGAYNSATSLNNAVQGGIGNWLYADKRGLFDKKPGVSA